MQEVARDRNKVLVFPRQDRLAEKAILEYTLPFGAEYLRYKLGWSLGFAENAIKEYRRFVVMALKSDKEITPSQIVDEVWHLHILHTKDYARFAEKIGHFLHHNPGGAAEMPRFSRQYEETLQFYRDTFKQEPALEFWPKQEKTGEISDDLESLRVPAIARENLVQDDLKSPLEWELFRSLNQLLTLVEDNYHSRKNGIKVSGVCGVSSTDLKCRKSFFKSFKTLERCLVVDMPGKITAALIIAGIKDGIERQIHSESVNPALKPLIKRIEELGYAPELYLSKFSTEFIAIYRR